MKKPQLTPGRAPSTCLVIGVHLGHHSFFQKVKGQHLKDIQLMGHLCFDWTIPSDHVLEKEKQEQSRHLCALEGAGGEGPDPARVGSCRPSSPLLGGEVELRLRVQPQTPEVGAGSPLSRREQASRARPSQACTSQD